MFLAKAGQGMSWIGVIRKVYEVDQKVKDIVAEIKKKGKTDYL